MPIYEYHCEKCDNQFEKLVFAGDEDRVTCPECGAAQVEKMISFTSFMSSGISRSCASGSSGLFS